MSSDRRKVRPGRALAAVLAGTLTLFAASCGERGSHVSGGSSSVGTVEKGGVRITFHAERVDEEDVDRPLKRGDKLQLAFQITDEVANEGLAGLHVGAWLVPRPMEATKAPDEKATRDIVRKLIGSSLSSGAYTNLNTFFFVTLNEDRTLALMDPFLDFSRTRMKRILQLPTVGTDIATGPGDQLLFVALPENGEVWVIDALTLELRNRVSAGAAPRRLDGQPGSGYVWVSDDASERVFVLDGLTGELVDTIDAGAGEKRFAFDSEGLHAYVCAVDTGTVTAVETRSLTPRTLADLQGAVSGFAYSEAARTLYACAEGSGEITAIDSRSGSKRPAPPVPPGSGPLYATRDGRWIFAVDTAGNRVHVLDAATGDPPRAIQTGAMPSQVAFTEGYAHVYSEASRFLTVIHLSALADGGTPPTLQIPITQDSPENPDPGRVGDFVVPTPEDSSVLIAAPDEKLVYYYAEGMMAPMGSYQNYSRAPVAVAVVDRSLQDMGNGFYTTVAPLEYHGIVDVYTYLDEPTQIFGHFELEVEPDVVTVEEQEKHKPLAVPEPVTPATTLAVGQETLFRFRLFDTDDQSPVADQGDVRVMAHARYGNWQFRAPARALSDGTYEVPVTLPEKGDYLFYVQSAALNLGYASHAAMEVTATDDVETVQGTGRAPEDSGNE